MLNSKQRMWLRIGIILAGVVTGILFSGRVPGLPEVDFIGLLPFMLLALAMLIAALFLTVILHEAGHLIFGLLTGYRFVSFNVAGLMLLRGADGRFRFSRKPMAGIGGQCLLAPPPLQDGNFPCTLYNMGGVLLNVVVALACFAALLTDPSAVAGVALKMLGGVNLYFALVNGLPWRSRLVQNDGRNQLCLRTPLGRRALWLQLSIAAAMTHGMRLKDMPEEWFTPLEGEPDNQLVSSVAVFTVNRLVDQLSMDAAEEDIRALLSRPAGLLGLHRYLLTCDGAVCELLAGRPADLTQALNDPKNQSLTRALRHDLSVLRTRYALALLRDGSIPEANRLLAEFKQRAPHDPYPQNAEAEKELLRLIQTAFHKEHEHDHSTP